MLSILIGHSYYLRFDAKQLERAKPYPPRATLQVAALLRHAGHQVQLFDATLASGVEDFALQLSRATPDLVLLHEERFNGSSPLCLAQMRQACFGMIHLARQRGARVIAAGADVSGAPDPYLAAGADAALLGEGLTTLLALLSRLDEATWRTPTHALLEGLVDIAFPREGQIEVRRAQALLPEPDRPGLTDGPALTTDGPAWDLVDIERYREVWQRAHGYFSLNIVASRGCKRYLPRSPEQVVAEMAYLKKRFAPEHLWFADELFGVRVEWVTELAQRAALQDALIPFTIQTRADRVSEPMAQALRQAGCREAWLGAASGSDRVLTAMRTGVTGADIRAACARLKAAGVRAGLLVQLGHPDEQLPDLLATRALVAECRPDALAVSVAYRLPGTRFYEEAREHLGPKRWPKRHRPDSGDLEASFWGAYTSGFYQKIRDLLHEQVALTRLPPAAQRRATRALQQRWQALLAREAKQRNPAHGHPEPAQPA